MRKDILSVILVGFVLMLALAQVVRAGEEKDFRTVTLAIKGMTCDGCTRAVKNALLKLEGVQSAEVSLQSASAMVTYDADLTSAKRVAGTVKKAGFKTSACEEYHKTTGAGDACEHKTGASTSKPGCCTKKSKQTL